MFSYMAYGLGIRSEFPLPELTPDTAPADVIIRFSRLDHQPAGEVRYSASMGGICSYRLAGVGTFQARGGRELIVDPEAGANEQVLRFHLLGWALGVLLHQRGLLVLHGSAVAINGGAVAFLGESGWGKSTIAAALHAGGHGFIADDIVALDMADHRGPSVRPASPRLRLHRETAVSLAYDFEALTQFHPHDDRREYDVVDDSPGRLLPLKRIYVLAEGTHHKVEPLQPREAFEALVRHSYPPVVYLLEITDTMAVHFRHCARLLKDVPICRLKRLWALPALSKLARLVEANETR